MLQPWDQARPTMNAKTSESLTQTRSIYIYIYDSLCKNLTLRTIAPPVEWPKQKHGRPGFSAKTLSRKIFCNKLGRWFNSTDIYFQMHFCSWTLKHTKSTTASSSEWTYACSPSVPPCPTEFKEQINLKMITTAKVIPHYKLGTSNNIRDYSGLKKTLSTKVWEKRYIWGTNVCIKQTWFLTK